MSNALTSGGYSDFLAKEYLSDFIRHGGSSVKFVVSSNDVTAERFRADLAQTADANGYAFAHVDASETKAHLVDQIFFTLARQLDWDQLACLFVRRLWEDVAFPASADAGEVGLSVDAVAARHDVDRRELYRTVRRRLEAELLGDHAMAHEFRLAMMRLCQAKLVDGDLTVDEHQAVVDWLRGDLRQISKLRSSLIFSRVSRHNAHRMLLSTAYWLSRTGAGGLVLHFDIGRLAVARRPPAEVREGIYYSKAATLDAYEVLRQLVDATDDLSSCLVTVAARQDFLTDDNRGLAAYSALALRLADEVRDQRRVNPFAALVRLDSGPDSDTPDSDSPDEQVGR